MNCKSLRFIRLALTSLTIGLFLATAALAGPPLICHSFDIGNAKSLPWISHNWNLSGGENYDTRNLPGDTLAILNGSQIPLVHMETLRRATLYARSDRVAAKHLLLQLVARAQSADVSAQPDPFAFFDAAYFIEAYKQWLAEQNPASALDSSAWLMKAMQLRPNDPQLAFGAALITLRGPQAEHRQFAQTAAAGAKTDELLARNLASHFLGSQSQTMAEMILPGNSNGDSTKVARQ